MLCQKCKKREATCHVTTIDGAEAAHKHLCEECFKAQSPSVRGDLTKRLDETCDYCGELAPSLGTDFLALMSGAQKLQRMCGRCSLAYSKFIQQEAQQIDSGLPPEAQLAAIRMLHKAVDKCVRQAVAERG